jgi:pimeloyl-ACP methyl ester carboxylesterase
MVDGDAPLECLLNRIARRTGSPEFKVLDAAAPSKLTIFEQIVSERLRAGGPYEAPLHLAPSDASQFDPAIDAAIQEDFDRRFNRTEIRSFDGARIRAYTAGDPRNEAVMIIPACGMPAKLCESWINFLAKTNFVLTTETRGLFDLSSTFDSLAWDVSAQAKDVLAVMDHFGVKAGHLMGLCGGAVVAAAAAIHGPQRVSSMSLWYGDFDLGPSSPKTIYQQNLKEVMLLAGAGRSEAESTHDLFCGAMVKTARADLAHLVLYPFATPELLYRYAKVNGSIMCTNIAPLLANPFPRTLVVTSQDDSTAHPAASREVAARLPKSVLHVEPHGDHLSFYDANPQLTELASRFIAGNST